MPDFVELQNALPFSTIRCLDVHIHRNRGPLVEDRPKVPSASCSFIELRMDASGEIRNSR
jgi:hypothetical protein